MAEISGNGHGDSKEGAVMVNINQEVELQQQQKEAIHTTKSMKKQDSVLSFSVPFLQKVLTSVTLNLQTTKNKKVFHRSLWCLDSLRWKFLLFSETNSVSYFVAIALFSVDGGDSWNVLFDIRRLCIGGRKRPTRQSRDSSWDRHRLGTHRHGSCLLSRSHLWRSFQSGGHDCVRILRPFPSQTGQHIHTIYNTYQVLFLCVILSLMDKLEPWRFLFDNSSLSVFFIVLH